MYLYATGILLLEIFQWNISLKKATNMQNKDKVIQTSYTKALEEAKSSKASTGCCSSDTTTNGCCSTDFGTEILLSSFEKDPLATDQSISFGCYRLDQILQERLKTGDTVIDFGSGPGHDLFLAARVVGSKGKAIGVDFTDAMLEEAGRIAKENGITQVELVKASIDKIPLEDNIANAIISNCVINLTMNKEQVFNEAFRLLKSGGQLIDADVISGGNFSEALKKNNDLWCSCIGGAQTKEETIESLKKAGFVDINVLLGEQGSFTFEGQNYTSYSAIITARKP